MPKRVDCSAWERVLEPEVEEVIQQAVTLAMSTRKHVAQRDDLVQEARICLALKPGLLDSPNPVRKLANRLRDTTRTQANRAKATVSLSALREAA